MANSSLAQTDSDIFGYNAVFEEEWDKLGQMSTEEFAQRYDANADYLQGISWDPTTAKYWNLFNIDPEENNKNAERQNYRDYDFRLDPQELAVFKKNGFVVSERMNARSFAEMFYRIYSNDLPVFVSADSILHAWHMSYDAMLKELEEQVLAPSLKEILEGMAEKLPIAAREYGNGDLESSLKDVDYFLAVARCLLKPNPTKQRSDLPEEHIKTYLNQG
ncbi:DUF3160 domain-containing protein [Dapis sp. BLCC M229]|uniref:DUF3160 domain-containing protein n=1 Tax=Dapis sp. BLCC M229 TaxID=3400188 RepID=UPI003CFB88C0